MKNICFIGAMSAELSHLDLILDSVLGEAKTSYYTVLDNQKIEISEKDVIYVPSPKLGVSILHAVNKNNHYPLIVLNEYENNVATVNSGVGLHKAFVTAKSIDQSKYEYFLNIGTAGALDESLKKGDIISIDTVFLEDDKGFYCSSLPYVKSFKNGANLSFMEFADNKSKKHYSELLKDKNIKSADMELYALRSQIPNLISIKIISDEVNEDSEEFTKNFDSFIKNKYNPAIEKIINSID